MTQYSIILCLLGSCLLVKLIYPYSVPSDLQKALKMLRVLPGTVRLSQDEKGIPISPLQG